MNEKERIKIRKESDSHFIIMRNGKIVFEDGEKVDVDKGIRFEPVKERGKWKQ